MHGVKGAVGRFLHSPFGCYHFFVGVPVHNGREHICEEPSSGFGGEMGE